MATTLLIEDSERDGDGSPLVNLRTCPRCDLYEIHGEMQICEHCEDEIAEENPDGQWCFSTEADCWIYE